MITAARRRLGNPYLAHSVVGQLRAGRWALLLQHFPDLAAMRVLDVGGDPALWANAPVRPAALTIVNVVPPEGPPPAGTGRRHGEATGSAAGWQPELLQGDGCALAEVLSGRRFDLVHSNSVIEHVGGHLRRRQLAACISQAGEHYWVQTPNRYFPIEPHWWFPGIQFLPLSASSRLARHLSSGPRAARGKTRWEAAEEVQSIELLSATALRSYFPDATVLRERYGGITKSLIALR